MHNFAEPVTGFYSSDHVLPKKEKTDCDRNLLSGAGACRSFSDNHTWKFKRHERGACGCCDGTAGSSFCSGLQHGAGTYPAKAFRTDAARLGICDGRNFVYIRLSHLDVSDSLECAHYSQHSCGCADRECDCLSSLYEGNFLYRTAEGDFVWLCGAGQCGAHRRGRFSSDLYGV